MNASSAQLTVQSLACRRGGRRVFHAIDFTLKAGDFLVVTGANGGGKSTLLRVLAGLLDASEGAIVWNGTAVQDDLSFYQSQINYIGHHNALKPELTVLDMLGYWDALAGRVARKYVDTLLNVFDLASLADYPIRQLSAGQKRRLALTRLTMNETRLWLLDEPVTALDAKNQSAFFDLVAKYREWGGIVIMASHDAVPFTDKQTLVLGAA